MPKESKTGSVCSNKGQIKAKGDIVTGLQARGIADPAVLEAALTAIQNWQTGSVVAEGDITADNIITGINLAADKPQFLKQLASLQETLAAIQAFDDAPPEIAEASQSLAEATEEANKEKPVTRRVINRLKETLEFMGDASKGLEAASKAGPLIAKALPVAIMLYQAAQTLF